jgi:cytochrome c oxidase subunit 1
MTDPTRETWLATADHKRLGLLFLGTALVFLLAGGVLGVLLRGELSGEGDLLGGDHFRVFSAHATVTPLLFLGPAWVGLATYVVPLQIGAARLALPRLHACSYWLYLVGGILVVVAYLAGTDARLGLSPSRPILVIGAETGGRDAAVLWITGLMLVALATFLAALDLVVTVVTERVEGMTFSRLPMFSTATFATGVVTLVATPVFLAGLVLLYVDRHYGGGFFSADNPAGQVVWQHTLWLFGRPEVYLLLLPGLGAACDIVATHARRPLLSNTAARAALGLFAALSLAAWGAGSKVADAVVLPTYSPITAVVALPVALLALLWLGSLAKGSPRFHVSLAFVAGFLGLAAFGAVNAVVAAFAGVEGGTTWTTAHVHMIAFAAPTLLLVGAVYHWAPKLFGRQLSAGTGALVFLALFGGFFLNGLGTYLLGYDGALAHLVTEYSDDSQVNYSRLAAAGGAIVALGAVLFSAEVARAWAGRRATATDADLDDGLTLEWAAPSPPPPANFEAVPEVRSAYPLYDLRAEGAAR